jgi:flagellar basal-body rod protein FlgB
MRNAISSGKDKIKAKTMTISFDKALGIHSKALVLREQRSEVLAANLANADTPGYKARDMDFKAILQDTLPANVFMEKTQARHLSAGTQLLGGQLKYRNPHQASLDGNTVEGHIEQAKYGENALQYQASLRFINGKISGMLTAIRGE